MVKISRNKSIIRSVFVLGSTSEISIELCKDLVNRGCKEFHLLSRNRSSNQLLFSYLESKANVKVTFEKVELEGTTSINKEVKIDKDYDLYILVAGYLPKKQKNLSLEEIVKTMEINLIGLIPWINCITSYERISKPGRLWVFSSVAGDIGRPSNYQYGAAKAALTIYCEGLIAKCNNSQFFIRLIKGGIFKTRMSTGLYPNFLTISPKQVSRILLKNIDKRGVEYIPWWWFYIMKIIRIMPSFVIKRL